MNNKITIIVLSLILSFCAILATSFGIFSNNKDGAEYQYQSIRGNSITIYGNGLYKHMSSEVAIQGIAQDYVTLFIAVPLLLISLFFYSRGSNRAHILLAGVLGYFLVTYLFYLAMAMYNQMFLVYVIALGAAFYALVLSIINIDVLKITPTLPVKLFQNAGKFLITNAVLIALLWLSVVVPPIISGEIIPTQVEHYTTLVVQGFDLALLLPIAAIVGFMAIKKNPYGYIFTVVYTVFLSLLMTALSAKIIFMVNQGVNVIPAMFIIPTINIIAMLYSRSLLAKID